MISSLEAYRVVVSLDDGANSSRVTVMRISYAYGRETMLMTGFCFSKTHTCFFVDRRGAATRASAAFVRVRFDIEPNRKLTETPSEHFSIPPGIRFNSGFASRRYFDAPAAHL